MKFSEKIIRLRKIKGITQDEFANAVGVSRQAVYKWECGQSYPEALKLIEIKALFGISIDDLLDDSYEIALPEKKKRKRISKVKVEKTEIAKTVKEETVEFEDVVVEESVVNDTPVIVDEAPKTSESAAPIEETIAIETVTDEAEKIIEEIVEEKTVEEPAYQTAPEKAVVEEKKPQAEEKQEEKKRGFFSRIFGRK